MAYKILHLSMKNTLLIFVILFITSCKQPISLANEQFYLVKPEMNGKTYEVVLCKFGSADVEIFAMKASSIGTADYTRGKFKVNQHQLVFPKGTFNIIKINNGYQLYAYKKLKYQLLTADGYKVFKALNSEQSQMNVSFRTKCSILMD
jgi:hypothetical protein